jgi:hypothetical protein
MSRTLIGLASLALLVPGCSGTLPAPSDGIGSTATSSTATPGPVARPTDPGELVLRIESGGGLLPPLGRERQLPSLSIYGDGLVLVPRPQAAEVDPAGSEVAAFRLEAELVDEIVIAAREVGLRGADRQLPQEGPEFTADAGATIVTVVADGARHVTSADALFDAADESDERELLLRFVERLLALTPPAGGLDPYLAPSYRVFVAAPDPGFGPELEDAVPAAWPFDEPLATWGEPIPPDGLTVDARCGVVDEATFADALAALRGATVQTVVEDEVGDRAIVAWRPILPDEAGC